MLNAQTGQQYPLVWQETGSDLAPLPRLPAIAYLRAAQLGQPPEPPAALGYQALEQVVTAIDQAPTHASGLLLTNIKPYFDAAIPYRSSQTQAWEPELQWSDQQGLTLQWLQAMLVALLTPLTGSQDAELSCAVVGLPPAAWQTALTQLAGVVVGCPTGWSDTYRFNIREALLDSGLAVQPDQIFVVEEAIAVLLAQLPIRTNSGATLVPDQTSLVGTTLVISAGATTTELLLVELPADATTLTREDLYLQSLAYAGDAIDQDIICRVLYPSAWNWDDLNLQSLDLPLPGEPDVAARDRLQQRLRSSDLGQRLLSTARQIKLALYQQETATFRLNDQQWTVSQQDLQSRVLLPYLQQLNRELNTVLIQSGTAVQAVRQVICAGGTTLLPPIAHWLKQKLPNVRLILADDPTAVAASSVAWGLARLPFYPQVLDSVRHQYGDYFLLKELLRILPNDPLSLGRILQLLENQGINTQFCQRYILRLLEGQLPDGLLPSRPPHQLLTATSAQNPDYQSLLSAPVFFRQSNQIYSLNAELRDRLQAYLNTILANTHQTLDEPLVANLDVPTIA